jgi:hypothetical protein
MSETDTKAKPLATKVEVTGSDGKKISKGHLELERKQGNGLLRLKKLRKL